MDRVGIDDPDNFFLSLGVFAVALIVLILMLAIYCFLKRSKSRNQHIAKLKELLYVKLFYQSWLRYLVESNLKITHQSIFYLYFATTVPSLFSWPNVI